MAQGVKAREASVLSKKPFLPTGSDREPVRPIDSHLRTELRSEERRQYEQRLKEKEAEMEASRQQVCIIGSARFMSFYVTGVSKSSDSFA